MQITPETYDFNAEFQTEQFANKTYKINFEEKRIIGEIDDLEAVKQAVYKILHTERFNSLLYSWDYGVEFENLIETIHKFTKEPILVLGRNNKDINLLLNKNIKYKEKGEIVYIKNKNIKLNYMTIHKSKGLESENVIIINLIDKETGLPNKIKDEKILRLVCQSYEKFPFSEERRLFYVALTRTKNYVYLLVPKKNSSIFVKELLKDNYKINNI